MQELITDFTLKSSIRRIVHDTYDRHMMESMSFYHDFVISQVWNGGYRPESLNQTADTKELVELLRKEYGQDTVEDKGIEEGFQRYEFMSTNVRFYIVQLPESYRISAARPVINVVYASCRDPKETITCMRAFNEAIPTIHEYIEQEVSKVVKDSLVCDITAATAKGMIDQLIAEEGLEIPPIGSICGTAGGRVKLYFADSSEKINCPLDYLRARLLRRFRGTGKKIKI